MKPRQVTYQNLSSSHEKKLARVYLKRQQVALMKSEWELPVAWPSEEDKVCAGSYFVPRTVRAVFGWGEGGRGNRHKWSNYLGMRSLFGSISSRLWPREAQPSSTTACVISSPRPPRCTRTFFSEFGRGTFCPAVGFVISPSVEQQSKWWAACFQ